MAFDLDHPSREEPVLGYRRWMHTESKSKRDSSNRKTRAENVPAEAGNIIINGHACTRLGELSEQEWLLW